MLLAQCDNTARDVVALTERDALADEIVGDLGGQHLRGQGGGHAFGDGGEGGEDAGGNLDAVA